MIKCQEKYQKKQNKKFSKKTKNKTQRWGAKNRIPKKRNQIWKEKKRSKRNKK